jgi:hypothetical protein
MRWQWLLDGNRPRIDGMLADRESPTEELHGDKRDVAREHYPRFGGTDQ